MKVVIPIMLCIILLLIAISIGCLKSSPTLHEKLQELEKEEGWRIVFTSLTGKALYSFSLDGKYTSLISQDAVGGPITYPSFSPDGSKIAFCKEGEGKYIEEEYVQANSIIIVNADGTNPQELMAKPFLSCPSWSPDGKKILFLADYNDQNETINLYTVDVKTRSIKLIVKDQIFGLTNFVSSWSPDSKRIVFASIDKYVTIVNLDNGSLQKLTFGDVPSWSPDGSKIAFRGGQRIQRAVSSVRKPRYFIIGHNYNTISPDGKDKQFLLDGRSHLWEFLGDATDPVVWSPDGNFVLWMKWVDEPRFKTKVCITDVKSKQTIRVATIKDLLHGISWGQQK